MASDDINKSSNLKVPPLRIVINSNNGITQSGTNGSTNTTTNNNNATNNFGGAEATDLNITASSNSAINLNAVPGPNNNHNSSTTTAKFKTSNEARPASSSNSTATTHHQILNTNSKPSTNSINSSNSFSAKSNNLSTTLNSNNTPADYQLDHNSDCSTDKDQASSATQRITRSSQRAAQQNRPDIQIDHPMTSADDQNSNSENIDRGNEQGRKTKKRKGESPENDQDSSASTTSSNTNQPPSLYQPPAQNSFQLYKNIRNQVDKRIKSLNCVHPKTPHGFKDYLLNRGVYLLDGNKLGNGSSATNIKNNESGNRGNGPLMNNANNIRIRLPSHYVVPEQIKAPNDLAISSPLHQLFVEQEKARHKMRMHHIKEREKLTLSAEQEILRVYNQAALAAANQLEPFSVCTLLKHQEIYNYIEPDEPPPTNSQQAQADTQGTSNLESDVITAETDEPSSEKTSKGTSGSLNKDQKPVIPTDAAESTVEPESKENDAESQMDIDQSSAKPLAGTTSSDSAWNPSSVATSNIDSSSVQQPTVNPTDLIKGNEDTKIKKKEDPDEASAKISDSSKEDTNKEVSSHKSGDLLDFQTKTQGERKKESQDLTNLPDNKTGIKSSDSNLDKSSAATSTPPPSSPQSDGEASNKAVSAAAVVISEGQTNDATETQSNICASGVLKASDTTNQPNGDNVEEDGNKLSSTQEEPMITEEDLSDDARSIYNKKIFFGRLQDIDDKWERIKCEMLIRHRNEAESLYAVQKLEWEWKAKEIGVCDVRTTPTIELTYVPKVDVMSLDY